MSLKLNLIKATQSVQELAQNFAELKRSAEEAARRMKLAEQDLAEAMAKDQLKTVEVEDGGKKIRATYVHTERTSIDGEALEKHVGKVKFRKFATLKVDNKKVEAALDSGELTPQEIEPFLTTSQSKPFIRLTEGAVDDSESA